MMADWITAVEKLEEEIRKREGEIMADWITAVEKLEEEIRKLENDIKYLRKDNLVKAELIAELMLENKELSKRPVVYIRVIGGIRRESEGGFPLLYIQNELGIYQDQSAFEPYTGENEHALDND